MQYLVPILGLVAWLVIAITWWIGLANDWRVAIVLDRHGEQWAEAVVIHLAILITGGALVSRMWRSR
jgi:hypothetical protein